jgi:hypothetical protein
MSKTTKGLFDDPIVRSVLENDSGNTAFFVGNGINRYPKDNKSWPETLIGLAEERGQEGDIKWLTEHLCRRADCNCDITYPEIFDALWFYTKTTPGTPAINQTSKQKLATEMMDEAKWPVLGKHKNLVAHCREKRIPILTANYDLSLEKAVDSKASPFLHNKHASKGNRSDTFLWDQYYTGESRRQRNDRDMQKFSVWHIHGRADKPGSIRLGLSDYIRLISELQKRKHSPFAKPPEGSNSRYRPTYTWIDYFYQSDLVIFGLGLGISEIDLRWLHMDRKRYSRMAGIKLETLFIHDSKKQNGVPLLEIIGARCIADPNYEIYNYFQPTVLREGGE